MIAIGAFARTSIVPHTDVLVMATYIAGQLLIVAAVLAATAGRGIKQWMLHDRAPMPLAE